MSEGYSVQKGFAVQEGNAVQKGYSEVSEGYSVQKGFAVQEGSAEASEGYTVQKGFAVQEGYTVQKGDFSTRSGRHMAQVPVGIEGLPTKSARLQTFRADFVIDFTGFLVFLQSFSLDFRFFLCRMSHLVRSAVRVPQSARTRARYGLRGVRVGEASHPGPPAFSAFARGEPPSHAPATLFELVGPAPAPAPPLPGAAAGHAGGSTQPPASAWNAMAALDLEAELGNRRAGSGAPFVRLSSSLSARVPSAKRQRGSSLS